MKNISRNDHSLRSIYYFDSEVNKLWNTGGFLKLCVDVEKQYIKTWSNSGFILYAVVAAYSDERKLFIKDMQSYLAQEKQSWITAKGTKKSGTCTNWDILGSSSNHFFYIENYYKIRGICVAWLKY